MKKRGLSTIVTTLIIILVSLVAVGIIWFVIGNILSGSAEEIFLGKFTLDLQIKNVEIVDTDTISMDVKRNPGKGDLTGIKFIFNNGAISQVFEEDIVLNELGQVHFNFDLTQFLADDVLTISIAPIFTTASGKKIFGNVISIYNVKEGECEPIDCTGRQCGSDGCGGTCPPGCGTGEYCQDGTCYAGTPDCVLTSASWSVTNVMEGTLVTLNVAGTNCAGLDLNYTIYEDEFIGRDMVTSSVVTGLSTTWVAQWIDDGIGQGDPEYEFDVIVVDNPSESFTSTNQLTVTQAQTCEAAGGTCQTNTCASYTDCTTLAGTCASGYCCSGTCTSPTTSYVSRSFSSSTVSAGEIVTVTLDVFVLGGETFYAIEEYTPSGWTIIDAGGGGTLPNTLKWAVTSGAVDTSYIYTIQAPSSTGIFDGVYMFEGFSGTAITQGQTTITVV